MNIPDFRVMGTRIPDLPINTEVTRILSDGKLSTFPTTIYNDCKFISKGYIKTTENYIKVWDELYIKESILRDLWLTENGLPEKWYIRGCPELRDHFKDINCVLSGSHKSLSYCQCLKDGDIVWEYTHLPDSSPNIITFDEFKKHYKMKKHITENNWYIRGCLELQNYFKEIGVNSLAGSYKNTCYYKDKVGWCSYGIELCGRLGNSERIEITLDEYKKHFEIKKEITENNWYIRGCTELSDYFQIEKIDYDGLYNVNHYYKEKGVWRCYDSENLKDKKSHGDKIEITLDEYKNYLNSKPITMKGAITPAQAQEIINMVGANCTWKTKLAKLWSEDIVLGRAVYVEDELYKEGYNDASDSQKKVLDKIFVKDFDLRDYKKNIDPTNHHFFSDLDAPFEMLVVGENKFQGLYLRHKQYDFKLETTEGDNLILKIKRK